MCHSESSKLCRGWLSVQCESVAVRLLIMNSEVTTDEVFANPPVPLFKSGAQAAKHGLRDINRPKERARKKINALSKRLPAAPKEK